MNAHQLYAAKLVETFSPADIAALAWPVEVDTEPKVGRRSSRPSDGPGLREVHDTVMLYADEATKNQWAAKLAEAAGEPRGNRPAQWALALGPLMAEVPQVDERRSVAELRSAS